jgi:glycerol-3-phosphate dehydrogenase subunit C
MKENFETALKVGKTAAKNTLQSGAPNIASECPLAAEHLLQGIEKQDAEAAKSKRALHPIQLLSRAYGLE